MTQGISYNASFGKKKEQINAPLEILIMQKTCSIDLIHCLNMFSHTFLCDEVNFVKTNVDQACHIKPRIFVFSDI